MREADDGSLRLCPAKNGQRPGRPVLESTGARVVLIFQTEEHEVAGMARRKSGDVQVVMHQPLSRLRQRMILAAEELFLEIVRGPPGEHGRDVEAFSGNLWPHVFR